MSKLNILFWNINNQNVEDLIVEFAIVYNVDVLVLIENQINNSKLLTSLNQKVSKYYFCNHCTRGISIYTSFNSSFFDLIKTESNFISLVKFKLFKNEILFGGIHLPSKMQGKSDSAISSTVRKVNDEIKSVESSLGHTNTLIVGDFNMNPFENAMVEHEAFNSVMCRQIAKKQARSVYGFGDGKSTQYPYFYNPMWSFLGDLSLYEPGTFYHYPNTMDNNFRWNMLDQVLIRPSLIRNFGHNSIAIIDKDIRGISLINSASKSRGKYQRCDHLPVIFTLYLN